MKLHKHRDQNKHYMQHSFLSYLVVSPCKTHQPFFFLFFFSLDKLLSINLIKNIFGHMQVFILFSEETTLIISLTLETKSMSAYIFTLALASNYQFLIFLVVHVPVQVCVCVFGGGGGKGEEEGSWGLGTQHFSFPLYNSDGDPIKGKSRKESNIQKDNKLIVCSTSQKIFHNYTTIPVTMTMVTELSVPCI